MASKEYKLAIKIAGEIEKSFYNSTHLTKKELAEIARNASATSSSISGTFQKGLKDAAPVFDGMASAGKAAFEAVATAATVAATATAAVVAASVSVGASFEEQMSTVQAISGATGDDLEKLSNLAKELGSTTQFTATEAGQAMEYMAMAGWKTNDMLNGMSGVLNLAAASGEDLATTSDIVTDAMTAFGLGANQVEHFADVLAATATNSNTTVSMMGETFTYAASLAGAMGYSIEDTATAIGLMANSGIKASQAGTALRKIFTETTGGATTSSKALGEYFIATQNVDGSMKDLKSIIEDMRYAFSKMTEAEKAVNAETIAGKTGMSGLLAIVNASEADYEKLTSAIYDCSGAAQEMAEIRIDNLSGDVTIMKSALEGLGIQIYEGLNEPLRVGTQEITEIIGILSKRLEDSGLMSDIAKKVPTAVRKIKELTVAVKDFSEPFFAVGGWLVDNPGVIVGAIASVGTAIATYKVASGIMSITTALGALGPVGWAILGIGGVVGIITGIGTAVKKSAAEAKKANLAAHFGNISLSMSELEAVASEIVSSGSLKQVRAALSEFEKLDDIQREIEDVTSEIDKANWKVSIGLSLSEEDTEEYQSNLASYVEQCQNYVEQQQYAVRLAVGVLTDDDLEGQNIVNQINEFYAGKQTELSMLGTKLNEAITDAFQDGLLDMDEAQRIADIQAEMAEIQAALAGTNFDAEMETISLKYGGNLDAESFMNLQAEIAEKAEAAKEDYEKAFTSAAASALTMLNDGAIDQATYDSWISEYKENYLEQVGEIELKASNFQMDAIMSQYDEELAAAVPELQQRYKDFLNETFSSEYATGWNEQSVQMWDLMSYNLTDSSKGILDKDTKAAISELLEQMAPAEEQMEELAQQYREAGEQIPQAIVDGINNYATLKALTGDESSVWTLVGKEIANDDAYQEFMEYEGIKGEKVPEGVADAIYNNINVVVEATENLHSETAQSLNGLFASGFDVETEVRLTLNEQMQNNIGTVNAGTFTGNVHNIAVPHAEGGIFDTPHFGVLAEAGTEAYIPIDGSTHAIDLWMETGKLLGINGFTDTEGNSFSSLTNSIMNSPVENRNEEIVYSPTLQFYGDSPRQEDIDEALQRAEERFEEILENYMNKDARLGFA